MHNKFANFIKGNEMLTEESLKPGVEKLRELDKVLTPIKAKSPNQVIQRDNKTIWGKHLHKWTNEDWNDILVAGFTICQNHPEYVTTHQKKCIMRACETLAKEWDEHPRVLDTKEHKATAWSAMLSLWEVFRQVQSDHVVNADVLRQRHYGELFELRG